ncbi:MAG TPA: hypothetical protein VFE48_12895 [Methylomirabilota bacterium]|nr:hypothetical protein [Methylomirabilota bacterium]
MDDPLERLAGRPLRGDGPFTRRFRDLGAADFAAAARHVWRLPYGRITERMRFGLVLDEGRGTCTTKHWRASRRSRSSSRWRSTR